MTQDTPEPQTIRLEYASAFSRKRSTRVIGVIFSLVFAGAGVTLAGIGCALAGDAVVHAQPAEILAAAAMLAAGVGFCAAAWVVQKRYVFPVG